MTSEQQPLPSSTTPARVVDAHDQGWYLTGDGRYDADYGHKRGLDPLPYASLDTARGPLRPVEPVTDEDAARVTAALVEAGTNAAGSVAVALYRLFHTRALAHNHGGQLLAGREGSWESAGLPAIAWEIGSRIAEKASRFNEGTVLCLVEVIDQWVSDRHRYTEVAETLAFLFGEVADKAGGWVKVADRYLQPGSRWEETGTRALYGYLMSTATTLDTAML